MSTDRTCKTLLALVCLALWIIILKPFLRGEPALAQTRKQYEMEYYNLTSKSAQGGTAEITNDLKDKTRLGWRVSSMAISSAGQSATFSSNPTLLILWEK